jgi:hypothetical protein
MFGLGRERERTDVVYVRISHELLWQALYPNMMATSKQRIIDPERDLILSRTHQRKSLVPRPMPAHQPYPPAHHFIVDSPLITNFATVI